MANNVIEVFQSSINDNDCRHGHRTFEAAMKCARTTIRRARRGEKFYGSDFAAKINPKNEDEVAIWIRRHLIAK
jgi:hypothetical protein